MSERQLRCHNCGAEIAVTDRITRSDTCPRCAAFLRCCLNCEFFDETAYNQCHEPQAERVTEKDKATFCSYFAPGSKLANRPDTRKAEARKKLDDLFKKK